MTRPYKKILDKYGDELEIEGGYIGILFDSTMFLPGHGERHRDREVAVSIALTLDAAEEMANFVLHCVNEARAKAVANG